MAHRSKENSFSLSLHIFLYMGYIYYGLHGSEEYLIRGISNGNGG